MFVFVLMVLFVLFGVPLALKLFFPRREVNIIWLWDQQWKKCEVYLDMVYLMEGGDKDDGGGREGGD